MQEAKWMKGKGRREKLYVVWAAALCYVIRVRLEKEMQEVEWMKGKGRREKLSLAALC
jgi:hypothetical protein